MWKPASLGSCSPQLGFPSLPQHRRPKLGLEVSQAQYRAYRPRAGLAGWEDGRGCPGESRAAGGSGEQKEGGGRHDVSMLPQRAAWPRYRRAGTAPTCFSTGRRGSGPAVCHVTQTRCPPRGSKGQAVSKPKETTTASLASLSNHLPNGKEGLKSEV